MRWFWMLVFMLLSSRVSTTEKEDDGDENDDFGDNLISQLRNDANLDLSVDEEYEDLRAELLAYHTTLAKLASSSTRRTMKYTPCWQMGGVCINYKLCAGFRYLTEVRGCRDKLNVCCFTWNRYRVKDLTDKGFTGTQYPWSNKQTPYGEGKGIVINEPKKRKRKPKKLSQEVDDHEKIVLVGDAPDLPIVIDPHEQAKKQVQDNNEEEGPLIEFEVPVSGETEGVRKLKKVRARIIGPKDFKVNSSLLQNVRVVQ